MKELWAAANATRSNLIMNWWTPNALIYEYIGTDAEMTKITLPLPTQDCVEKRVDTIERCSANQTDRVGDPAGACDEKAKPLEKLISGILYDMTFSPDTDPAIRSPGYDVFRYFKLTELQLGEMFQYWNSRTNPREAICDWIVDNMEYMETFVSPTYPRTTEKATNEVLSYVSTIVGVVATIIVFVTAFGVYKFRKTQAIVYAQIEFLFVLLAGAFLVAVGATIQGLPPTNGSCVTMTWLINLGYTMEMVPLIVKVAAINRMMSAARQMRRIVVKRISLFGAVIFLCLVMLVFLAVWTAVDMPRKQDVFELTSGIDKDGATIVEVSYYCASESRGWEYGAVGWSALLLLCATVIAYQTRNVQRQWNESRPLATMIYSHFVFVVLRILTVALRAQLSPPTLQQVQSLFFSVDTIAGLAIYFIPKLAVSEEEESSSAWSSTRGNHAQRRTISGLNNHVTTMTDNASQNSFTRRHAPRDDSSAFIDDEEQKVQSQGNVRLSVQFTLPCESISMDAEKNCIRCLHCGHPVANQEDQEESLLQSLHPLERAQFSTDNRNDRISDVTP